MLYNEKEHKQYMKKRNRLTTWGTVLCIAGFMTAYVAASTDDARTIHNDKTAATEKTTIPMALGGLGLMSSGLALLFIRDMKYTQR